MIPRNTQQAANGGVGIVQHFIHIGLRDAQFLSLDQRKYGPAHNVKELVIAMAHRWRQGFL